MGLQKLSADVGSYNNFDSKIKVDNILRIKCLIFSLNKTCHTQGRKWRGGGAGGEIAPLTFWQNRRRRRHYYLQHYLPPPPLLEGHLRPWYSSKKYFCKYFLDKIFFQMFNLRSLQKQKIDDQKVKYNFLMIKIVRTMLFMNVSLKKAGFFSHLKILPGGTSEWI